MDFTRTLVLFVTLLVTRAYRVHTERSSRVYADETSSDGRGHRDGWDSVRSTRGDGDVITSSQIHRHRLIRWSISKQHYFQSLHGRRTCSERLDTNICFKCSLRHMRPSGARTLIKYKVTRPPKRRPSYVYKKKKQIYIYLNLSKTLGVPRFNVVYIFYRITFSYILLFTKKRMQKSDNLIQKKKIKKKIYDECVEGHRSMHNDETQKKKQLTFIKNIPMMACKLWIHLPWRGDNQQQN